MTIVYNRYAWDKPVSKFVALRGGPRDLRWYTYRDWITNRLASWTGGYWLDHPCGASRCYAPTFEWVDQVLKNGTTITARVWQYHTADEWWTSEWGGEYLTPDEVNAPAEDIPAQRNHNLVTPAHSHILADNPQMELSP
jgi:hypothetical protein